VTPSLCPPCVLRRNDDRSPGFHAEPTDAPTRHSRFTRSEARAQVVTPAGREVELPLRPTGVAISPDERGLAVRRRGDPARVRRLAWAKAMSREDLARLDAANEQPLNRDVWYSIRGYDTPYPGDGRVLWPSEVPAGDADD
jgi:hypothetical protein